MNLMEIYKNKLRKENENIWNNNESTSLLYINMKKIEIKELKIL